MAADVLMGHDPDCGRWITVNRVPTPEGEVSRRRVNRRAVAGRLRRTRPLPVADDALVIFTPSGRRGRFATGTTVLDAARSLGVDIDSVCGGRGHLRPLPGDPGPRRVPEARHHVRARPPVAVRRARGDLPRREGPRAPTGACRAPRQVCGDVLIDVPPESQVHRQVVRKGLDVRDLHRRPGRPPPLRRGRRRRSSASPTGDLARLFEALEREWELTGLEADLEVIRALQPALEAGEYGVTVAVHEGRQVIGVWPGLHETAYGVAIDVGSTTIAGHLANLADGAVLASNGVMNPQIRFGEDLMSRVSYAMMHPEGAGEMTAAVRKALDGLIALAGDAGRDQAGRDPRAGDRRQPDHAPPPARHRPDAARRRAVRAGHRPGRPDDRPPSSACAPTRAPASTSCRASPATSAPTPPASSWPRSRTEAERMTLVVDVGTNAEIVLGDRRRLLAASSPTGPAFEGAQISGGQRAAPGAIERVRIDRDTLEPRFRVIGVRRLVGRAGLRGGRRRPSRASPASAARGSSRSSPSCSWPASSTADGVIDGALAARTPRIVPGRPDLQLRAPRGRRSRGRPADRASPRTTSGRSSWPRPRCTPASGC